MSGTKTITIVVPEGRLDAAGARPLEKEFQRHLSAGETHLLVDLRATRYISSNGLRVLLSAEREARALGGELKLCCMSARLFEIFEMSGFDQVFEIFETREPAIRSFD